MSPILLATIISLITLNSPEPNSRQIVDVDLPYNIPDDHIYPLRKLVDKEMQTTLEAYLKKNKKWDKLIRNQKMAVGVVDLSDPYRVKFARVNGNHMMYAASLPKLAILLAATQALEDSIFTETEDILYDLREMISQSDNSAATRIIDLLGFERIEQTLTDPRYELYDPEYGGGLWVGKRYAKLGRRYPDPIMGLSHGASVTQVCRFYYLLAMGKLVNPHRSAFMLDILEDPELHHKFVNPLDRLAPEAKIFRKSGTWKNWHSDSVLVWGPVWRRYIAVALVEDSTGEIILRNLIPVFEEVLQSINKS